MFSYGRGTAGRQIPGQPLPDHGKQEYDLDFHGGNYATVHPQFYRDTLFRAEDTRAPDHGSLDILQAVLPSARKRGIRTICWTIDKAPPATLPNIAKLQEVDLHGRNTTELCFNNPYHRNFLSGLVEDYARSYEIDGLMWASERRGPLINAFERTDPGRVACFCPYCEKKAKSQRIDFDRARQGYLKLEKLVRAARSGQRPVDGYYVAFWRLFMRYPEILAWETFWNDSLREAYRAIYDRVKSVNRNLLVGWHLAHSVAFSPLYRAEQDLKELAPYSDFIKMVMYHNCAGERMARYVGNAGSTLFADLPKEHLLEFEYRVMNFRERGLDQIPYAGFSADYVHRETKRTLDGLAGSDVFTWPGIDIDIPTAENHSKSTRDGTREAVARCLSKRRAHGVVLSRKYSEMKLDNLSRRRGCQCANSDSLRHGVGCAERSDRNRTVPERFGR